MVTNLFSCDTAPGVRHQNARDQVAAPCRQGCRRLVARVEDEVIELSRVVVLEGQASRHHGKEDHSQRPNCMHAVSHRPINP